MAPAPISNPPDGPTQPPRRKVFIETVGCQMNLLDSELVVGRLRQDGYELTDAIDQADAILFNTCSVREHAENKIYSALGRLKDIKRERPGVILGVLGCMAQKDQDLVLKRAPHVDLVVGPGQLAQVPEMIEKARAGASRQVAVSLDRAGGTRAVVTESFEAYDALREPSLRPSPHQAFVRVMMGCDKFCTFCIVPSVRGPEQGRPPQAIIDETRVLVESGAVEITLLGQTVNSYKYREGDGRMWRLSDLLVALHDLPGLRRLKFVTSYPNDMTDDLLQAVRDLPRASKYLHVPAQSGCDDVLRRMKRLYTVSRYDEMMRRIRETIPGAAVSSDFIVGFCGETEASFEKSIALVERSRFKNSFIFKYSARTGTKANQLYADDVPEAVKRRRNNELLAVQNAISEEDNQAFVGRTVELLVEGPSKWSESELEGDGGPLPSSGPLQLVGRTSCDRIVVFHGASRLIGRFIRVTVESASPVTLFGQVETSDLAVLSI
jgi:tRNA-2-methylthio-N6-dimethylallyladenosine synthase